MNPKFIAILFVLCTVRNTYCGGGGGGDYMKCEGGNVQCCNEYGKKEELNLSKTLGLLAALSLQNVVGNIGLQCSPVTASVIGGGGSGQSCTQQTVCCSGNNFNGLIALGCTPINLNLG